MIGSGKLTKALVRTVSRRVVLHEIGLEHMIRLGAVILAALGTLWFDFPGGLRLGMIVIASGALGLKVITWRLEERTNLERLEQMEDPTVLYWFDEEGVQTHSTHTEWGKFDTLLEVPGAWVLLGDQDHVILPTEGLSEEHRAFIRGQIGAAAGSS